MRTLNPIIKKEIIEEKFTKDNDNINGQSKENNSDLANNQVVPLEKVMMGNIVPEADNSEKRIDMKDVDSQKEEFDLNPK